MEKVICQNAGLHELCNGCGAAVPHNPNYCEPCPVDQSAHCDPVIELVITKPPDFSASIVINDHKPNRRRKGNKFINHYTK